MKRIVLALLISLFSFPLQGGTVRTKDRPKECGGYRGSSYHLKCEGEKKGFVNKEQRWKNLFEGFTKKSDKPGKQGTMPHSP